MAFEVPSSSPNLSVPVRADIPTEFLESSSRAAARWDDWYSDWRANGVDLSTLTPAEGVDAMTALTHLCAIQNADLPADDKRAAITWLASTWYQ